MILDTNALSALADGSQKLLEAIGDAETLSIPVIVLGEFRFGVARSRYRARYREWLGELVDVCRILDVDQGTANRYAEVREVLRIGGRPIPSNDAWIAALALQHELPVVSRDAHFDEVVGIRRVSF